MNVSLGINNCFAVKRWPLADEWAQIVGEELELDLVQHSLDLGIGQADDVREACRRFDVRVESVFTGLAAYSMGSMLSPCPAQRASGFTLWSDALRFAGELGAASFGGHVGSLSRADADDDRRRRARWSELERHLHDLRAIAPRFGVGTLLVENMACDREPCRMSEIESLMSEASDERAAVSLCLDVGHQCVPGASGDEADPYAWLRLMGRRASVIHLQQSDASGDHHWPFTSTYNRLGRIDAPRVLEALEDAGVDEVAMILEVIPTFEADDRQVLQELGESVDYWKDALDG
jgi:D-erythrulose 1-phosphate 3-epimerase